MTFGKDSVAAAAKESIPARRFVRESFGLADLIVESKTIGTSMTYNLSPRNFSRTGMLLSSGRYKKLPFKVNTLLEMTIDTRGVLFPRPVQVLGKVVRLEDGDLTRGAGGEEQIRLGVQILRMEHEALDVWETRLAVLEEAAERLLKAG